MPPHVSPKDLLRPLGRCSFPFEEPSRPVFFSAANSCARGDFVISYKRAHTLHVLWCWVKIRTRLRSFEIPLSFEPLTSAWVWLDNVIPHASAMKTAFGGEHGGYSHWRSSRLKIHPSHEKFDQIKLVICVFVSLWTSLSVETFLFGL